MGRDKRNLLHGSEARRFLLQGIKDLAAAVKVTLGAEGHHVVIEDKDYPYPIVTRDGVAVAESITFGDNRIEQGARMAKEAARECYHVAGDGTTSTIVITEALCNEVFRAIEDYPEVTQETCDPKKRKPNLIAKGIKQAALDAVSAIEGIAMPVTEKDLVDVAVVSANNDEEMGALVAKTVWEVGENGSVVYKHGKEKTSVEVLQGSILKAGYLTPEFVNTSLQTVSYAEPTIYVTDLIISRAQDVSDLLKKHLERFGKNPIVIIAKEVLGDARSAFAYSFVKQEFPICLIEAPYEGERQKRVLKDLAAVLGATFLSESKGHAVKNMFEDATSYYGKCKRIDVYEQESRFIGGYGHKAEVDKIVKEIKTSMKDSDDPENDEFLKNRLAWMTGKVAIVSVAGTTPMERTTKIHRLDDSVKSSQAALGEGMVIGGASTYLYAYNALQKTLEEWDSEKCDDGFYAGYEALTEALLYPSVQILLNAGMSDAEIDAIQDELLSGIKENDLCVFNVLTGSKESLAETHIFDSAKVVKTAIMKAASVGSVFATTEVMNYDEFKYVSNKREDWFGN